MFWCWNDDYENSIQDGLPFWYSGSFPSYKVPQWAEKDPLLWVAILEKLKKVCNNGCIAPGDVILLTNLFSVPKTETKTQVAHDGTKSVLNATLWAPWFTLPTIEHHLQAVEPGTFMGDLDIRDMFLNFVLTEKVQLYAGVDLTPYFMEKLKQSSIG